jgi:hypothetical protein
MNLREIGWGGLGTEWIHLARDRDRWWALVKAVMNLDHKSCVFECAQVWRRRVGVCMHASLHGCV